MKNKHLSILLVFVMIISLLTVCASAAIVSTRNPYEKNVAGKFDETNNDTDCKPSEGSVSFGFAKANYVCYKNMNFTDAPYAVSLEIGVDGEQYLYKNTVWVRIDDPESDPIATVYVTESGGGWGAGMFYVGTITEKITGIHDVYISSNQPSNFWSFSFMAKLKGEKIFKPYSSVDKFGDMTDHKYKREAEAMYALGVATEYEEGLFYPDLPIMRGEFADWMAHFMTDEIPEAGEPPFKDIEDYQYANEICYLYSNGIVKLNEAKTFSPYDFITVREASAMLLRFMGYETMVEYKGGWPYGYDFVANDIGLTGAMASDDYLRRSDAAKILYNAVDAEYLSVGGIKNDNITFERKKGVLEETRNIYKATGIVTATNLSGLVGDVTLPDNSCCIGNERFTLGDEVSVDYYLGVKCEYYYQTSNDGDTKTLLYITPSSKTQLLTLSGKDVNFAKIASDGISYTDKNDKEKKVKINTTANWIYNNKSLEADIASVIPNPAKFGGTLRLVDNGNGYETIYVEDYKNVKIQSFNESSSTLVDELSGEKWSFANKTLYISDGTTIVKANLLKKGQLVELYLSYDGEVAVLLVGESVVNGVASEITSDGKIVIGNTEYTLAKENEKELNEDIILGQTMDFYISRSGEIVYVKAGATTKSCALLSNVRKDRENVYIELYTASDETKEYKTAKKIYVDGKRTSDYSDISVQLMLAGQYSPVLYEVNSEEELTMIDTPNDLAGGDKDTLNLIRNDDKEYRYQSYLKAMAPLGTKQGTQPVNTDGTAILSHDSEERGTGFSFYKMSSVNSALSSNTWHKYSFYSFTKNNPIADLAVSKKTTNENKGSAYFAFKEYSQAADSEGNKGINLKGVTSSGEKTFFVPDSQTDVIKTVKYLKPGDVANVTLNYYGEVVSINLRAFADGTYQRGDLTANVKNSMYGASDWYSLEIYGKVVDTVDDYLVVEPVNFEDELWLSINTTVVAVDKDGKVKSEAAASNIQVGSYLYGFYDSAWKIIVAYEQ